MYICIYIYLTCAAPTDPNPRFPSGSGSASPRLSGSAPSLSA